MSRLACALLSVIALSLAPACAPAKTIASGVPETNPPPDASAAPDQAPAEAPAGTATPPLESADAVSFEGQVLPILQSRCSPCHFEGGVMYARLPFDRPATIRQLGERLFTRIKKEEEQTLIRKFLAQDCGTAPSGSSQESSQDL